MNVDKTKSDFLGGGGGEGRVKWRENGFQSEKQNNIYSLTFCAHALDPLKTARGVAETRLTVKKKMPKDHNSGKNRSSMTPIKYDHLQVMETITGKFHQIP